MITGLNPADMYGVDHTCRVLLTFPGFFPGIGEFTVHKEFVSTTVAGETASLQNPALDGILAFAADVGLIALIHNDLDVLFARNGTEPAYLSQTTSLLKRHPNTTILWAHAGMGRVVRTVAHQASTSEPILRDPRCSHLYFDISWGEVAKYLLASPEATAISADLINHTLISFSLARMKSHPQPENST